MKKIAFLVIVTAFLFQFCSKENLTTEPGLTTSETSVANRSTTVTVPDGSVDKLAQAIAQAGPGGTVILATGTHTENSTVTIPYSLNLIGQNGAVLKGNTSPSTQEWVAVPQIQQPVLHFKNAAGSKVENISIETTDAAPDGLGILMEDSDRFRIIQVNVTNHQSGFLIVRSSNGKIEDCQVHGNTGWTTGAFTIAPGIGMVSGKNNFLTGNEVTGQTWGVFTSGKNGVIRDNFFHDNSTGLILCTFPKDYFELPGGETLGAEYSSQNWKVLNNEMTGNAGVGILVIDGSNANVLIDNNSHDNGGYDIELTGDLPDYLTITFPPSKYNLVKSLKYPNAKIKDCGIGNVVIGGKEVDYTLDPCQ